MTSSLENLQQRPLQAIVIGASAGGVEALRLLLGDLPAEYGLPVLMLLHLPEDRESRLSEVFRHIAKMPVEEAQDKQPLVPGTVYVAGSGYHLSVEADRSFSLSCEAPVFFSRPSIDILMESAAQVYGAGLLGILLTGANQDGAAGMASIAAHGGFTIVQDPAEAQVRTMPAAAIALRTPDMVLGLAQIRDILLTLKPGGRIPDALT